MFSDIAKYGFLNAKIRARIGNILSEKKLLELRNDYKFYDILNFLTTNGYIDEKLLTYKKDIKNIEFLLFKYLVNDYKYIYNSTRGGDKNLKNFIQITLQKLEIDNLKNSLRIWFSKNFDDEKYIIKDTICYPIDYDAILNANNFDEILNILKPTPYINYLENIKDAKSIFKIELELDRGYFKNLFAITSKLDRIDKNIIKKFIGFKIDVQNLLLLLRYKNYYKLNFNDAMNNLIPFGGKLNNTFFNNVYSSEDINIGLSEFIKNIPTTFVDEISDKINKELNLRNKMILIEDLLNQAILSETYNTLGKYPFTIGIVISYFLLKEAEINNLISLVNLKYYEL